jgi:hypothetical protein
MTSYEKLLGHIENHGAREWLRAALKGAKDEDANTIRRALEKLTVGQFNRRFARMLADR